jgi:hypothetical protein
MTKYISIIHRKNAIGNNKYMPCNMKPNEKYPKLTKGSTVCLIRAYIDAPSEDVIVLSSKIANFAIPPVNDYKQHRVSHYVSDVASKKIEIPCEDVEFADLIFELTDQYGRALAHECLDVEITLLFEIPEY